jgi:hypothetical protein
MLVIAEGLDRVGKTTLTEQLATEYGLERRHFSKPQLHPLDEYCRPVEGPPRTQVFDRYHWGERVWPQVFNRDSQFDGPMFRYVELLLESRGAVIVYAQRNALDIAEACARDGEEMQPSQVLSTVRLFDHVSSQAVCPVFEWELKMGFIPGAYDPGVMPSDLDKFYAQEEFVDIAKRRALVASRLSDATPRWIGHLEPNVLLVGDQVGPGSAGWTLPFVPYRSTSGHFLMEELMCVPHIRPAIVNSQTPEGYVEPLAYMWRLFGKPPIVPLGKRAERVVREAGVADHATAVPHPQWWRRFNRKAGLGAYGAVIQEAANV